MKTMPAVSKNQAIAMNLAQAVQRGQATAAPGSPSAEIASSMRPSAVDEFAGPIPAGLPKRVKPPVNVGGPGPGRPKLKMKNVGKPVKKFKF
jgi:hypothetical protein